MLNNGNSPRDIPDLPPLDFENNEPARLGPCSREVHLASNWIVSIDAWDFFDPKPLELMLKKHPIPEELRFIIADMVTGKRTPNKKAAAKLKFPAAHRMVVAGIYRDLKADVIDATLKRKTLDDYHQRAADEGKEVIELQQKYLKAARKFKLNVADNMGISTEALDNICDALSEKIKNFPNI